MVGSLLTNAKKCESTVVDPRFGGSQVRIDRVISGVLQLLEL
jgi:hypothetical protein